MSRRLPLCLKSPSAVSNSPRSGAFDTTPQTALGAVQACYLVHQVHIQASPDPVGELVILPVQCHVLGSQGEVHSFAAGQRIQDGPAQPNIVKQAVYVGAKDPTGSIHCPIEGGGTIHCRCRRRIQSGREGLSLRHRAADSTLFPTWEAAPWTIRTLFNLTGGGPVKTRDRPGGTYRCTGAGLRCRDRHQPPTGCNWTERTANSLPREAPSGPRTLP